MEAGGSADAAEGIPATKMPCFRSLRQLATIDTFRLQSSLWGSAGRMYDPATPNHIGDARFGPR